MAGKLDDEQFWAMVQGFSEPDGVFAAVGGYRSDNLVSNERSLQQVIPDLLQRRRSGAYIGVGPEQNFTYITAFEPTIAFVIDIRRENLLLHLMYKALAEESIDRVEFLSRLFARPRPSGLGMDTESRAADVSGKRGVCSRRSRIVSRFARANSAEGAVPSNAAKIAVRFVSVGQKTLRARYAKLELA